MIQPRSIKAAASARPEVIKQLSLSVKPKEFEIQPSSQSAKAKGAGPQQPSQLGKGKLIPIQPKVTQAAIAAPPKTTQQLSQSSEAEVDGDQHPSQPVEAVEEEQQQSLSPVSAAGEDAPMANEATQENPESKHGQGEA